MVSVPMYCRACDAITGHDLLAWNRIKCARCGLGRRAPLVRWIALPIIIIILAAIPIYVIATSVFVQQVLIIILVLLAVLIIYFRFRNSRYYARLAKIGPWH